MTDIIIETVAASNNESCIRTLFRILSKNFPSITFDIVSGYRSHIEVNSVLLSKDTWNEISDFSDGFIAGWEERISVESKFAPCGCPVGWHRATQENDCIIND